MSKHETGPSERLVTSGATDLERRLLDAAGREQPSRELSERMARAIGISMPAGGAALPKHAALRDAATGAAAPKAAATSSLWPWVAGTIGTAAVVMGIVAATRDKPVMVAAPPAPTAAPVLTPAPPAATSQQAAVSPTSSASPAADNADSRHAPAPRPSERAAPDLSDQLALVDAAHRALSRGDAAGALSLARKYSTEYPAGTFRPEASAIRIEALVKMGRSAEARALADKFATTYGPGPLTDRVAALVGSSQR